MERRLIRLLGMVMLLVLTAMLASGCGKLSVLPSVGPGGQTGKLIIKTQLSSEGGVSTQWLKNPIASYQVSLRFPSGGVPTKTVNHEFQVGQDIVLELLNPGTWSVIVTAIDTAEVQAYSGWANIDIQAGHTTDAAITLTPRDATINMTADLTNLFTDGTPASYVTVDTSYQSGLSTVTKSRTITGYHSFISKSNSIFISVPTPRTVDFTLRAYADDDTLLARQVLTDYQVWPGENINITWTADTPQSGNGAISILVGIVEPLDVPTNFTAVWNHTTSNIDMEWVAPADCNTTSLYYIYGFEVQVSDDNPYSQWTSVSGSVTTMSKEVPNTWRGRTVKIRMYASDKNPERYSVASNSVSVTIPALP